MDTAWAGLLQDNKDCLQFRMNKLDIPRLIADLVSRQVLVNAVNPMHSLENYFLSLTTKKAHEEPIAD